MKNKSRIEKRLKRKLYTPKNTTVQVHPLLGFGVTLANKRCFHQHFQARHNFGTFNYFSVTNHGIIHTEMQGTSIKSILHVIEMVTMVYTGDFRKQFTQSLHCPNKSKSHTFKKALLKQKKVDVQAEKELYLNATILHHLVSLSKISGSKERSHSTHNG